MKKVSATLIILAVAGCRGFLPDSDDPLSALLTGEPPAGWQYAQPAEVYDKDSVFELIDGEADLYFPYGFKRVVAARYKESDDAETEVSVEAYELASLLDAFGVFSNFRDEESTPSEVGAEAIMGSTQLMFYQDRFFVKVRINKPDMQDTLTAFARRLAAALPQNTAPPPERDLLDIEGVVQASRQYLADRVLGHEFFKNGMIAKVFLEDDPGEEIRPLRAFVLQGRTPGEAGDAVARYIAYLDHSLAEYEWVEIENAKVLKADDPLHQGVLIEQTGRYILGVAKIPQEADGAPLLNRLKENLPPAG